MVGGRHHLFFVLVEKLQHLLRGAVAGEAVDVVADGGIEGAEGLVQRLKVAGYLPQDVLVGALLLAHVLQKLPRLVELASVGDDPGVQDLFQRFEKRRHLRHKGQRRLFFVAAGLFGQPAGAPQPQQKAQRQRVGVAGGLLGLIARVVSVQCQRLCQRGEVILGPGYGLGPQDAVICRVAALLPQQEQQLCIKCPVRPRQRAEQPRGHQFKQLHGNVLSCSHQNTFLLYHKTTRFDRETIQNCRRVRFGKYQRKNYFKFCISETTAVVSELQI